MRCSSTWRLEQPQRAWSHACAPCRLRAGVVKETAPHSQAYWRCTSAWACTSPLHRSLSLHRFAHALSARSGEMDPATLGGLLSQLLHLTFALLILAVLGRQRAGGRDQQQAGGGGSSRRRAAVSPDGGATETHPRVQVGQPARLHIVHLRRLCHSREPPGCLLPTCRLPPAPLCLQAQAALLGFALQLLAAVTKWRQGPLHSSDATASMAQSLLAFLVAGALVPALRPAFYRRWRTPLMIAARLVYLASPMFRSPHFIASVFEVGGPVWHVCWHACMPRQRPHAALGSSSSGSSS